MKLAHTEWHCTDSTPAWSHESAFQCHDFLFLFVCYLYTETDFGMHAYGVHIFSKVCEMVRFRGVGKVRIISTPKSVSAYK